MLDENDKVKVWLQVLETAAKQDKFLPTKNQSVDMHEDHLISRTHNQI